MSENRPLNIVVELDSLPRSRHVDSSIQPCACVYLAVYRHGGYVRRLRMSESVTGPFFACRHSAHCYKAGIAESEAGRVALAPEHPFLTAAALGTLCNEAGLHAW